MDFDLSADQEALRAAAADLLDHPKWWERLRERIGPGTVVGTLAGSGGGDEAAGESLGYDEDLWAAMTEQGWLEVEDFGGMVEVAVLCEQLGRRVAPVPFFSTVLAAAERVPGPSCVAWPATGVTVDGKDRLSGQSGPVVFAPTAATAIVVIENVAYAVEPSPLSVPLAAMDRTRELGRLTFTDTPSRRIGDATRLLDRAATAVAAEMLGAADRVLEMAVQYAKDRVQFGKPIGSFQAVKHRLADALVDVEGMRSTVYYAAWCLAADSPDASLAASMAKAWCSDASRRVMATGLQVHGGIGFTWEHDLHLYLKRAQLDQVSYGDAPFHRDRVASLLGERVKQGVPLF